MNPSISLLQRLPMAVLDRMAGVLALPLLLQATHRASVLGLLTGSVTLVGPRVPAHPRMARGLICLWWLRTRSNIDFGTEAEADAEYLRERSLRGDLSILARAIIARLYGAPQQGHDASITIQQIRLLNLRCDELLDAIAVTLRLRTPMRIAFVNPDCVNIASHDAAYRQCLTESDWVCADGIGMKIAGNLLGRPVRQNINGTDLFPRLCESLAQSGHRLFLLGGGEGIAEQAASWAEQRYPGLAIAGTQHGFFPESHNEAVIAEIRASRADVLLVAMGAPRQEKWLSAHFAETGAVLGAGVGGLFDYYSGRIPRAPQWLRDVGGEWLYRLYQEPRRLWQRYLVGNVVFLVRIFSERVLGNLRKEIR